MKSAHIPFQIVQVGEQKFYWRIHRQLQWCTADGYKVLTLWVELAQEPQRTLIIEFPFEVVKQRSCPHWQRPPISPKNVMVAISLALEAGWKPQSRGKPFIFEAPEPA